MTRLGQFASFFYVEFYCLSLVIPPPQNSNLRTPKKLKIDGGRNLLISPDLHANFMS